MEFFAPPPTTLKTVALTLGEAPLAVLELLSAGTHIVADCVAEHVVERPLLRDISTGVGDNEAQLGFVIARAVLGDLGDVDLGRVRPVEGGSGLDEEDRLLRDGHARLFGVVPVVETQAPNDRHLVHG